MGGHRARRRRPGGGRSSGGAAYQIGGGVLGVRGDGRDDAAADQQRAAGERRGAHRVGVADQGGHDVGVAVEHRRQRVAVAAAGSGPSAPARSWSGGWWRQTYAGRSSSARRASSQASWSSPSRPGSTRPVRRRVDQRVEQHEPRRRRSRRRSASRCPSPATNASRTSWLPGQTASGPVPAVEPGPRLGVLLGRGRGRPCRR